MKKQLTLVSTLMITGVLLTACGNDGESTNPNDGQSDGLNAEASEEGDGLNIRMANQVDEGNFLNQGYVHFKEVIEEQSEGYVNVEIHNGGTLTGSDEEIVDALEGGTVELSTSSAYGVANTTGIDGFNLFDMPYVFEDREEFYSLLDGEYGEHLAEQMEEETNLKLLGFIDLGYYSIMNGESSVAEPDDLNGMTIRSSAADLHLDTMSTLGANPTPMNYSEVFTGLQQGTIDGVSTTTPLIYGDRFFEVNEYFTATNHILLPHILMVNKDFYNGLSDEDKGLLHDSVDDYLEHARNLVVEAEEEALEGLADEGVEVVELSEEERGKFEEKLEPVVEDHIDTVGQENYDLAMELLGR